MQKNDFTIRYSYHDSGMNRLTDYFEKVILSEPMKDDNIFLNYDEYVELVEYVRGSDFYNDIIHRKNVHKKIIFHGDEMFSIFFYHSESDELFFIVYSHVNNEFRWKSWDDVNVNNVNILKSNLVDCNSSSLDDNPIVKKYYEMHQTSDFRDVNIEREAFIVRDIYMFGQNIQILKEHLQKQIEKLEFYFPYTKDKILKKLRKYKDQVMLEEYYNCLTSENMAILGF